MRFVQSPYTMLHHPLFRLDSRRAGWALSARRLRNYSWGIVVVVHLAVFGFWGLLLALYAVVEQNRGTLSAEDMVYDANFNIVSLMTFVVIALGMLLDLVSVQAAVKSINTEVLTGRWDLLRLTALNERGIVAAKHAGVRLRAWRFTTMVASARLATVGLWLFAILIAPYFMLGENMLVEELLYGFSEDPFSVLISTVIVALTALIYVLEPFWRMQSMTALGMVLSAYILSIPLATLTALAVVLAVWLLQCFVALALMFGLGFGFGMVLAPLFWADSSLVPGLLYLLLACIITSVTVYGFYAIIQTWSLRRVQHRILKSN